MSTCQSEVIIFSFTNSHSLEIFSSGFHYLSISQITLPLIIEFNNGGSVIDFSKNV